MGLKRIGMQTSEIGWLLTVEFLLFFGAPIAAVLVHSTFAMIDFSHLVNLKKAPHGPCSGRWLAFTSR